MQKAPKEEGCNSKVGLKKLQIEFELSLTSYGNIFFGYYFWSLFKVLILGYDKS